MNFTSSHAFGAARRFCALVLLGIASVTVAHDSDAASFSYFDKLKEAEARVGPLAQFSAIDAMTDAMTDAARAALMRERGGALQALGTMRSLAGDADGAARAFAWWKRLKPQEVPTVEERAALAGAVAEDAIAAIVREARTHQIVVLNEAHHIPMQRVFAAQLARELRKIGFEYLACETFDERIALPLANGYVEKASGFYSKESMFAAFLRSALQDNWKFVGYDAQLESAAATSVDERWRLRESGAVEHLMQGIFLKNPKAKVLIYVGYSHALEEPAYTDSSSLSSLAALLKYRIGVDPLTIDQSLMFSYPDRRAEHPLYRAALANAGTGASFVLKAPDGGYEVLGSYRHRLDMQVFHPDHAALDANGRPEWMTAVAHLLPRTVPPELLPKQGRRLIQAFDIADGADAVPVDMVIAQAGQATPALMLPAGEFRFEYEE